MPSSAAEPGSQTTRCWVCDAPGARAWRSRRLDRPLEPEDLRITDQRYGLTLALRRCDACGFVFADAAELERLTSLYEGLVDPGYEESQEPRRLQMRCLLDAALRARPHARSLLDVGAAAGLLVAEARARGLDALGVEPSRALCDVARARHGIDLLPGVLPHPVLDGRRFDLVFLIDVLEHVANPVDLLRECARRLAPAGVLVLVTPDAGSVAARLLRHRWWHFRLAHVGYFDHRSLARAVERAGLVTIAVRRARWYFGVEYLVTRLGQYLPLGRLTSLARRSAVGRALLRRTIPLDLRDSFLVLLRQADAPTG